MVSAQVKLLAAIMQAATDSGRCWGTPGPGCTVTFTAVPANYSCGGGHNCPEGPAQLNPVTVTFSQPVYQLIVFSSGAFLCSGTYGRVTAYNRTHQAVGGLEVEQRDFVLFDPSDCGEDGITCCGVDTLKFPGGIAKVVIEPPQPGAFVCCGQFPESAYAHVSYFYSFYEHRPPTAPCVTGDELLDQQVMRDLLRAAWDSSNANDASSNRRETRGWLFEDSTGNLVQGVYPDRTAIYPDTVMDTPCSSVGVWTGSMPGIPLAAGHTHPFASKDTLPFNCPQTQHLLPGQFGLYDIQRYGGASDGDIRALQRDSLPMYILDKQNIYGFPLGTTLKNAKSVANRYPRVDPITGCVRL